jgi:hypothetical protein
MTTKKRKRQCISCDEPLRKGVARRALVLLRGEPVIGLCCIKCIIGMLPIVIPPPTTIAPLCACCKRGRATTCDGCVRALEQNVKELTHANVLLTGKAT